MRNGFYAFEAALHILPSDCMRHPVTNETERGSCEREYYQAKPIRHSRLAVSWTSNDGTWMYFGGMNSAQRLKDYCSLRRMHLVSSLLWVMQGYGDSILNRLQTKNSRMILRRGVKEYWRIIPLRLDTKSLTIGNSKMAGLPTVVDWFPRSIPHGWQV